MDVIESGTLWLRCVARLPVEHAAPCVRVQVRNPGALWSADTVGVILERACPDHPVDEVGEPASLVPAVSAGGAQ